MSTGYTFVIPARIGSKGVRGKNYQPVGGLPLICHAIDLCAEFGPVRVSTNDPMIWSVVDARYRGSNRDRLNVDFITRPEWMDNDEATIDEIAAYYSKVAGFTPLCVFQPTTIGLSREHLSSILARAKGLPSHPLTVVTPNRHAQWFKLGDDWHTTRDGNRQTMAVTAYSEIGVRIHRTPHDDTHHTYQPLILDKYGIVDVDTPEDLERARHHVESRTILFRPTANRRVGLGHLYRTLALAERLQHHQIMIDRERINMDYWDMVAPWTPWTGNYADVAIIDGLDTSRDTILKSYTWAARVVTLEDRGPGAEYADVVINDMYPSGRHTRREHVGPSYAVLRPEFLAAKRRIVVPERIRRILVTFGGMDAGRFTERYLPAILDNPFDYEVRVVPPPGRELRLDTRGAYTLIPNPSMASEMVAADLVITSAGRTLYEAAAVGAPAIALAQNHREADHIHLGRGNVYLGDGRMTALSALSGAIQHLDHAPAWRRELSEEGRSMVDRRGTERVAAIIEEVARS